MRLSLFHTPVIRFAYGVISIFTIKGDDDSTKKEGPLYMKWDDKDASDERVVSQGRWCDIRNIGKVFPNSAGVYLFADESLDVKYVGCAKELGLQNAAQDSVYKEENYGAKRAFWLATENREEAQHLRRQLVKKYLARKKRKKEL